MATLYWITGLPGAGKTTIGKLLYQYLREKHKPVVFLDGDELRLILNAGNAYSGEERKNLAIQYAKLCKLLVDQGINVVCATVSMFKEVRDWNAKNIQNYREIYIKVSSDVLSQRDKNKLYSEHLTADQKMLHCFKPPYAEPENPHVLLLNNGSLNVEDMTNDLINKIELYSV